MPGFEDRICYYKPYDSCFSDNFRTILSEIFQIYDNLDQFEIIDDS